MSKSLNTIIKKKSKWNTHLKLKIYEKYKLKFNNKRTNGFVSNLNITGTNEKCNGQWNPVLIIIFKNKLQHEKRVETWDGWSTELDN